ncbi:hypothetical protein NQ318_019575 [Aromia moschata]|uniref:MI domain-containing protein n=1 Tax=Aromia moschata TaxID=1265417 RepID=A0AAV8Z5Y1_9CUCU|nr:hypothetical protein NQ318_019575 [Aromia moschata]
MVTDSETNSPERKKRRSASRSPESKGRHRTKRSPAQEKSSSEKDKNRKPRVRSRSRDRRERRDRRHADHENYDKLMEEYPRSHGEEHRRQNSDRYWNKYPRRDDAKSSNRHQDKTERSKVNESQKENKTEDKSVIKPRERKTVDLLTSRTGGAYIPPAKLRMMQENITDKSSAAYQRIAWEALKKSIHGYINKVNTSNIGIIARELLHENIVRGRGLLCKSIIQAQAASPTFTNVYAALVAVINSKFPNIGELLLKRLVLQFRRGSSRITRASAYPRPRSSPTWSIRGWRTEILALEILTLLVETPTDDSVEVAISFLKECGQKLTEVSGAKMLRNILHEGQLEKRIQYMIEVMFQIRKDGFKDHAAVIEELDVVEEEDQFTHLITLDDVRQVNAEDILNVFKFDENYEENEGKYKTLSKEILEQDSESGSDSDGLDDVSDDEDDDEDEPKGEGKIIDNTETNLITLRRTIYLTIQSSLDFEECAHKLMKMELKPGQEIELCHMFLDCCAEQRTYEKFYGLLAQRFCQINKSRYSRTRTRPPTGWTRNRLRNVSKFFAHLLFTDAIGWEVLDIMKLNEEDTNSSSRIFIKILFQELAEYMGLGNLNARLKDPTLHEYFAGLFPRDSPKNTRFSINFFTSIGLGGLTDELREHLKNVPKNLELNVAAAKESSSESSSDSSSEASSSSDSSSSEEDEEEDRKRKRVKKKGKDENVRQKKKRDTSNDDSSSSEDERGSRKKLGKRKKKLKEEQDGGGESKGRKKERAGQEQVRGQRGTLEETEEAPREDVEETIEVPGRKGGAYDGSPHELNNDPMIEIMIQIRKEGFKDHAAVIEELDVVEEEDQVTHLITLNDFDENYEENEGKYKTLSKEILEQDSESSSYSDSLDDVSDEEDEAKEEGKDHLQY